MKLFPLKFRKKFLIYSILALLILDVSFISLISSAKTDVLGDTKTKICHCQTPQGKVFKCNTLEVAETGAEFHLREHENDYLGACRNTQISLPLCNSGQTCTACLVSSPNTCSNGNGVQTCTYETYTTGAACLQNSINNIVCTKNNCFAGFSCTNGQCVSPTPTPTNSPTLTPSPTPTSTDIPGVTITETPTPAFTPTPTPSNTIFTVNIGLDGIGSTGDNINPTNNSGSNKNPIRTTRNVTIEVYNFSDSLLVSKNTETSYDPIDGRFKAAVDMGIIPSGNYTIKIKSEGYLRKLLGGIQSIVSGQTFNIPQVNLITGDVNADNSLSIIDYNILISCSVFSSDESAACAQNPLYRIFSDLEDNGIVDQFDYNLFVREYSVQNGQ